MIATRALRAAAVVIAIGGVVDPVLTVQRPVREALTIVAMAPALMADAARLATSWDDEYTVTIAWHEPSSAAACPSTGACVIVSSGAVPERLTAGAAVAGAVRVAPDLPPAIASLDAARRVHLESTAIVTVGLTRQVSRIEIFDGDVLVGSAAPGDALEAVVTWVPVATGARRLGVVADGDRRDVGVIVHDERLPVLVYEPRASWLGTFVRRALEDDARFEVGRRTRIAPPVTVSRGAGVLSAAALEHTGVAVVTSPGELTATEVSLLERYVAERAGSLVLLPESQAGGPIRRLMPAQRGDSRRPDVRAAGPLQAREWLFFEEGPATAVIASLDERPVVVSQPIGRGRVIVSGALDAWRYRDAAQRDFWTALVAAAGAAAGPPLRIEAERTLVSPGEQVAIDVERQTMGPWPAAIAASGEFDCEGERGRLRLWPDARPGRYTTAFRPSYPGVCRVRVSVDGVQGESPVLVGDDVRRLDDDAAALTTTVQAHGGVVVGASEADAVRDRLRRVLPVRSAPADVHPLRSPLWLVPFAGCLAGEWWLRRRRGNR